MCVGNADAVTAVVAADNVVSTAAGQSKTSAADSNALLKCLLENAAKTAAAEAAAARVSAGSSEQTSQPNSLDRSYKLAAITPEQQRQMSSVVPPTRPAVTLPLPTVGQPPVHHQRPPIPLSTVARLSMTHPTMPSRPAILQTTVMRPGLPHSTVVRPQSAVPPFHEDPYPWSSQLGIAPEAWATIPRRDKQQLYGAKLS